MSQPNPLESIFEQIKTQANNWWSSINLTDNVSGDFENHLLNATRASMVAHGFKGASIHESSFNIKDDRSKITFEPIISALKDMKFGVVYQSVFSTDSSKDVSKCLFMVSEIGAVHILYNKVTVLATSKENLLKIKKKLDI